MIKISVSASKKYDVIMDKGIFAEAGSYIKKALGMDKKNLSNPLNTKKICIVTDATVAPLYAEKNQALVKSLTESGFEVYKYTFPGGEKYKTMGTVSKILEYLADNKFTRSDLLLALGGGITGDITGFTAATYLRGIDYIQVPTTLLATVDSSVGGKTGVNLVSGKNLAGAFWQPRLVLFDPNTLSTLSQDLKLDGIAEAVKAGMIADSTILELVEDHPKLDDYEFLTKLASLAIEVKRKIVEEDEREKGNRQLLNFGHTLAHAIEKCSEYSISHGHAVAMGMAIVSKATDSLSWNKEKCYEKIIKILEKFNFPLNCPFNSKELTEAATQDKKIRSGNITLIIPYKTGECRLKTIPVDELEHFIFTGLNGMKGQAKI